MLNQKMIYSAALIVMVFAFAADARQPPRPPLWPAESQPLAQAGGRPGNVQTVAAYRLCLWLRFAASRSWARARAGRPGRGARQRRR